MATSDEAANSAAGSTGADVTKIINVQYTTTGQDDVIAAVAKIRTVLGAQSDSLQDIKKASDDAKAAQVSAGTDAAAAFEKAKAAVDDVQKSISSVNDTSTAATESVNKTAAAADNLSDKADKAAESTKTTAASTSGLSDAAEVAAGGVQELGRELSNNIQEMTGNSEAGKVLGDVVENLFNGAAEKVAAVTKETNNLTKATESEAVATEVATVATKGFGTAFKAIGIGLLVSLLAYLIDNLDKIKAKIVEIIPGAKNFGDVINTVKDAVTSFGKALITFIATPLDTIITLFTKGFGAAAKTFLKDLNLVNNTANNFKIADQSRGYQKGIDDIVAYGTKRAAELKRQIQSEEALGRDTTALREQLFKAEFEANAKDTEKQKDALASYQAWRLGRVKKDADDREKLADAARKKADAARQKAIAKAQADRKKAADQLAADMQKIAELNAKAQDTIDNETANRRVADLQKLQNAFDKEKALFNKRGEDTTKITEAYNIDRANINKKYDEQIANESAELSQKYLNKVDDFEAERLDATKKINNLMKSATADQRAELAKLQTDINTSITNLKNLSHAAATSQAGETNTEANNIIEDTDSPATVYNKQKAVLDAQRKAEADSYALQQAQAQGNADTLLNLAAQHNLSVKQMNKAESDDYKAYQLAKLQQSQNFYSSVSSFAGATADIFAKNTVAYKALALAQATIDTYTGIAGIWKNTDAYITQYGPALALPAQIVSTGIVAAQGIAAVKNIMKVDVGGGSSSGTTSVDSAAIATASTVNTSTSAVQDVRVTNSDDAPVRAYITEGDLDNSDKRKNFKNSLSSL